MRLQNRIHHADQHPIFQLAGRDLKRAADLLSTEGHLLNRHASISIGVLETMNILQGCGTREVQAICQVKTDRIRIQTQRIQAVTRISRRRFWAALRHCVIGDPPPNKKRHSRGSLEAGPAHFHFSAILMRGQHCTGIPGTKSDNRGGSMQRVWGRLGLPFFVFAALAFGEPAPAFEFKGFMDVDYASSSTNFPAGVIDHNNKTGGFSIGSLDLYLAEPIGDRLEVLSEIAIEPDQVFGQEGVDVERIQVGYIVSDLLKIRAGRFHTVLGFWNTAYHHGSEMQTTIERPEFLNFEDHGGILPVHAVGLWFSGRYRATGLAVLNYDLMLSNGSRITNIGGNLPATALPNLDVIKGGSLDMNLIGDDNPAKQVSFHLALTPSALMDFRVGLFGDITKVQGYTDGQNEDLVMTVAQQIYGADVEYINQDVEFISEYYHFLDRDQMGGTGVHHSKAFYAQLGVPLRDRVIPYFRYEQASLNPQDPYFFNQALMGYQKSIGGVRYNLTSNSSLKAEVQWVSPDVGYHFQSYTKYKVQWAFGF